MTPRIRRIMLNMGLLHYDNNGCYTTSFATKSSLLYYDAMLREYKECYQPSAGAIILLFIDYDRLRHYQRQRFTLSVTPLFMRRHIMVLR